MASNEIKGSMTLLSCAAIAWATNTFLVSKILDMMDEDYRRSCPDAAQAWAVQLIEERMGDITDVDAYENVGAGEMMGCPVGTYEFPDHAQISENGVVTLFYI